MNLEINIPINVNLIDDDKDALLGLGILIKDEGIPLKTFDNLNDLMAIVDNVPDVFIIDYHLSDGIKGNDAAIIIKEKSPDSEFIFISSLLTADEYETLINTCGCNAISRKEDYQKIIFLIKRAIGNIQKRVIRAMEIVTVGRALLEKIDNY